MIDREMIRYDFGVWKKQPERWDGCENSIDSESWHLFYQWK